MAYGSVRKRTSVPEKPVHFPSNLWPQTNAILLGACKAFPSQPQMPELCKHVIREMTPVFVEAVKAAKIEADAVLIEGCGGMASLLHSILVYNDDGPKSGFASLTDEAYRLGQELKQSKEWLALAKAIADAKPRRPRKVAATIGRNIDMLRKECGWSFEKLSSETGIEKKLIVRHVNEGTKPIPRTLRDYAQAFTEGLGRNITALDLEK